MAVLAESPIASSVANGVTTTFPHSFTVLAAADLVVKGVLAGVTSTYALGVHYTVTGIGSNAGSVVFLAAPPAGQVVTRYRDTAISRTTDYQQSGDFLAAVVNADFDRSILILQEIFNGGKGVPTSLRVANGEAISAFPVVASRAGRMAAFDELTGDATVTSFTRTQVASAIAAAYAAGSTADAVTFLPASGSAVARSVQAWLRNWVVATDCMTPAQIADITSYTGAIDVTTPLMAAITYAWQHGKKCFMPSGTYKANITLPIYDGINTYQGDAFELQGEGAGNGFLGGAPYIKGTTVIGATTAPTLWYKNLLPAGTASGNHVYIRHIRFDNTSPGSVVLFERFSDYSIFDCCEVRQHGSGSSFRALHAYGGTISNTHAMNDQLVDPPGVTRTGVAFDIQTVAGLSGGLLRIHKCTGRGHQIAYNLGGSNVQDVVSTVLDQVECSTVTYGIFVASGMVDTVIQAPYFEGVENTCIRDQGQSTKVLNGQFFEGYAFGIDNRYDTYGTVYSGNRFHLATAGCVGIAVLSNGDATGTKKIIEPNLFYFMGDGGTLANVTGIQLTGVNPQVEMGGNSFRPPRAWVGGAGTKQITDSSTGRLSGSTVTADALSSFTMLSGVGLSLSYTGNTLTQANVSAGVLTLPVDSSFDVVATAPVTVTSMSVGLGAPRIVRLSMVNANMTLAAGANMLLAGNFTGPGVITLEMLKISGAIYAYEIGRAALPIAGLTYNPPSIAAGASTTTTIAAPGAVLGDHVLPSFSLSLAGLVLTGYVSAADTVTAVLMNPTGAAVDLASGTLRVKLLKA